MYKEIKQLRKKFFILSASITFVIILVMLSALNLLMQMSYHNELETAAEMLTQTAYSNAPNTDSEVIMISDTKTNENGDHIILRDPSLIQSIAVNGEISCKDHLAEWYAAGGGIYFEQIDSDGKSRFINKEYKFNRGNSKITVDLTDKSDFVCGGKPCSIDMSKVKKDNFWVSVVWWSMTGNSEDTTNPDVKLDIESIEIQYKQNISVAESEDYKFISRDFKEIYPSGVPQTLSNFSCFYFITDKNDNLMEINSGNTSKIITENDISEFMADGNDGITFDDKTYSSYIKESDDLIIHTFMHNIQAENNSYTLLLMSLISGSIVFVLVLVLIYLVSGKAVKPISESYEKQRDFISNASHELKTPITVISATTELMEKKNGSDRLITCIQAQSQKMSRLVNEMLTLTRLSNNEKQPDEFKQFDISSIAGTSVLYFESRAFEEGKRIVSEIQENLKFTGDQNKIDELIGILLDNALKYSDDNSEIKLSIYYEKGIVIVCENSCANFSEEDLPHLFERFYRADKSHSNQKDGFGLGLSIAREIVILHKGTINAEYKDRKIRFIIKL